MSDKIFSSNVAAEIARRDEAARQAELRRQGTSDLARLFGHPDLQLSDHDTLRVAAVLREAADRQRRIAEAKATPNAIPRDSTVARHF